MPADKAKEKRSSKTVPKDVQKGVKDWAAKEWDFEQKVVHGRYVMHGMSFLGQGSFSLVRQGIDTKTGEPVAIKLYTQSKVGQESKAKILRSFKKEINILQQLHKKLDPKEIKRLIHEPTQSFQVSPGSGDRIKDLDPGDLFVKLLDFSRDEQGNPCADVDGNCYIVLEIASYTLEEYLKDRRQAQAHMSIDELREVTLKLVQIFSVLHAKGFVHFDIKPQNIMKFEPGGWKMIDLDGAIATSSVVTIGNSEVCFTPLYCPPEVAHAVVHCAVQLKVSRSMDVWSIGMTILDCIFLKPVLLGMFTKFYQECGNAFHFLMHLSKGKIDGFVDLKEIKTRVDDDMYDLLSLCLQVDKTKRAPVSQFLSHRFFWPKLKPAQLPDAPSRPKLEKRVTVSYGTAVLIMSDLEHLEEDEKDFGVTATVKKRQTVISSMMKHGSTVDYLENIIRRKSIGNLEALQDAGSKSSKVAAESSSPPTSSESHKRLAFLDHHDDDDSDEEAMHMELTDTIHIDMAVVDDSGPIVSSICHHNSQAHLKKLIDMDAAFLDEDEEDEDDEGGIDGPDASEEKPKDFGPRQDTGASSGTKGGIIKNFDSNASAARDRVEKEPRPESFEYAAQRTTSTAHTAPAASVDKAIAAAEEKMDARTGPARHSDPDARVVPKEKDQRGSGGERGGLAEMVVHMTTSAMGMTKSILKKTTSVRSKSVKWVTSGSTSVTPVDSTAEEEAAKSGKKSCVVM